jgi:hypothetical protein
MFHPAPKVVRDWLKALGSLTAGSLPGAEVDAKLGTYAPLLAQDFPPSAFCPASLAAVARQCKFFPSYAEICDLLSPWWRAYREQLDHIAISDHSGNTLSRERDHHAASQASWQQATASDIRAKVADVRRTNQPMQLALGQLLAKAVNTHATHWQSLIPPEWLPADAQKVLHDA